MRGQAARAVPWGTSPSGVAPSDVGEVGDEEEREISPYPQFDVLAPLRGQLFDELSAEELIRFYPQSSSAMQ